MSGTEPRAQAAPPVELGASRSLTTRVVDAFLGSNFSLLLILMALAMGATALIATPREEDPQVIVPFIDVFLDVPGANPEEVRQLAAEPLERLFFEIHGVEHVYSMASQDHALVTVRFAVGEDREKALVDVDAKIRSNSDRVPPQVKGWRVVPVEIDDVPILTVTLYDAHESGAELVRLADELAARLQSIEDVSRVDVHGGERRVVRVLLDTVALRARGLDHRDVARAIGASDIDVSAGMLASDGAVHELRVGPKLSGAAELGELVVAVEAGRTVLLRDVAEVVDGPAEPTSYTRIAFGPAATAVVRGDAVEAALVDGVPRNAVTVSVAKRKGTNAVVVAEETLAELARLKAEVLPPDVRMQVTRNHGETANEKVNELVGHLLIAVGTIVVLIGASLGARAALIVALAVPLTLAVTLFAGMLVGFTINRVTLFALILSLGLLVDDPIVDVENIHRHLRRGQLPPRKATLFAVDEVRPPVILATLAVMLSFVPMFFVSGMMGPYMRPMPFNVPVAMLVSLIIAFTVTPWASYHLLRGESTYDPARGAAAAGGSAHDEHAEAEVGVLGFIVRGYRRLAHYFLARRRRSVVLLAAIGAAFVGSIALAGLGHVPLKMLPFDNKSEFQVTVEAPEGTALEVTDRAVLDLTRALLAIDEVTDVVGYTGHASPHDFNGLVRHHFLRNGSHQADLRVNLLPRHERGRQAHAIVLAARPILADIAAQHGVRIGVVETPPGPPVLAGIVAEVYPPLGASADELAAATRDVEARFHALDGLADVDSYLEADRERTRFDVDRARAAVRGVSPADVAETLRFALSGVDAGVVHVAGEREPLRVRMELPRAARATEERLAGLSVRSATGEDVPLQDLLTRSVEPAPVTLFRKDMRDVQYVTAEPVGLTPVEAVFALEDSFRDAPLALARSFDPTSSFEVEFAGEGEWQVTLDVFRDLGIAFAGALAAIYVLLVAQTGSFGISALMMLAIPLTMIGVFPGFWLLNTLFAGEVAGTSNPIFFTATGMIGVIALAGIVVRNSIILVDFIQQGLAEGRPLLEACVEAGAVRLRPILLTAGAAVMGAWVIVFDPIFSGLAWSFVFGVAASTVFTLLVIPVMFALTYRVKRESA
ncbi:MAG: efflux RND transporter permease subunit [Planctomycetota bacterium]